MIVFIKKKKETRVEKIPKRGQPRGAIAGPLTALRVSKRFMKPTQFQQPPTTGVLTPLRDEAAEAWEVKGLGRRSQNQGGRARACIQVCGRRVVPRSTPAPGAERHWETPLNWAGNPPARGREAGWPWRSCASNPEGARLLHLWAGPCLSEVLLCEATSCRPSGFVGRVK